MARSVGFIANPVSGTDIRRLSSYASFVDNNQKAYILLKAIKSLEGIGIDKIILAQDFYGIAQRTLELIGKPNIDIEVIDIPPIGGPEDTLMSTEYMVKMGVSCIVILGGDGTIRIASKASRDVPLIPISTGTNNVIPYFIDGSIAGFAAGVIALYPALSKQYLIRLKRLDIIVNGERLDHALVDVGLTNYLFKGAKAILDIYMVSEAVVSIAKPTSIGIANIAAMIKPINPGDREALYFRISKESKGITRKAIIAPGVVKPVRISDVKIYETGDIVMLGKGYMISLDGERELEIDPSDDIAISINPEGPYIVDIEGLMHAVARGILAL